MPYNDHYWGNYVVPKYGYVSTIDRQESQIIIRKCKVTYEALGQFEKGVMVRVLDKKEVSRTLVDEKVCKLVSKEEVKKYRRRNVPSLVIKDGDKLYYCQLSSATKIASNIFGTNVHHLCGGGASVAEVCHRLLSKPYEEGGCDKVFAFSKGIENYPFITQGYETFGLGAVNETFYVAGCSLYKPSK